MRALSFLLGALVLTSCARTPPSHFYALESTASSGGVHPPRMMPANTTVYIGPVTVPEAIDRPQLVVRQTDNELGVLEGQRWVEPLKIAIGRVLATTLTAELGNTVVGAYPGTALTDAVYRVQVDVQKIDISSSGSISFDAVWSVRRAEGGNAVAGRTVGTQGGGADYRALAGAYTQMATRIGRDIAQALGNQVLAH
ncbi:MAG: membrane integrity-associated transporter subunit PqiC [Gammaproteobacteria bacterium]|nr:membrane integrity-associated transporter subunit PqiC [Gammaproteobacteria bacterium]